MYDLPIAALFARSAVDRSIHEPAGSRERGKPFATRRAGSRRQRRRVAAVLRRVADRLDRRGAPSCA